MRLIALLLCGLPVFGWGPEGHALVSRIALTELTPAAKARIAGILGPGRTLVSVSSWADEVRRARPESANWHFVDIPITAKRFNRERDCARGDCVVGKIEDLRRKLQDPALSPDQRREALMFLIHFVGDMHEPLHCADDDDRGGNTVRVVFFGRQTNLHSVWDSGLLGRLPPEDQLFTELSADSARNAGKWRKGDPVKWSEECHKVARKAVYGFLPKAPEGAPVPLGPEYEKNADPVLKEQLAKAGTRLAVVLNSTLR
jgi:hypothetical protein